MIAVELVDPHDPRVADALRAYMTEVLTVCGMNGVSLTDAVHDVADYCPPSGAFLALVDGQVIACAGIRRLDEVTGELKRMWVSPALRGQGVGAQLLQAVERHAVEMGFHRLRLDTHDGLTAAMRLYTSHGYVAIADYNGNPDATHFFQKRLRTIQG